MGMSLLQRLQEWYADAASRLCPGFDSDIWDRIEITNLDNPGWIVVIKLYGTDLSRAAFAEVRENYDSQDRWVCCAVQQTNDVEAGGPVFVANGGPLALERMLEVFLDWAAHGDRATA